MSARRSIGWATATAAVLVAFSASAQPHKPAGAPPMRLNYSTYRASADATAAISALRAAEEKGTLRLEAFALVGKDAGGKVTILDRRQPDSKAGSAVASVTALLVGGRTPATTTPVGGGTAAFLTGADVRMSRDTMNEIKASLLPGETALVTVVLERWAPAAGKLQETNAERVLTHAIPGMSTQAGFDSATRDPQPDRIPKSQQPTSPSEPAGPSYRE
jgi:hypothetical protein